MANSEVQICNEAIAHIGGRRILALTDASAEARLCQTFYATERDALLRSHRWNFAKERKVLAQLNTAPAFNWDYAYQLPTDCLRVMELNGSETDSDEADEFEIEGQTLLTDAGVANVVFIKRTSDVNLFDPLFCKALALLLGAKIARTLSGSESLGPKLLEEAQKVLLPMARRVDSNETKPRKRLWPIDSDFVKARYL